MKFIELARVYEELEKTSSYNTMRDILSSFFKKVSKNEMEHVAYLTLGQIASDFEDVNLGMAEKMVIKSIAVSHDQKEETVLHAYKKAGDIGKTAEQYASGKGGLTVETVFQTLHKIAEARGTGSQEKKIALLGSLLLYATKIEARYLARIVLGDLRLGIGDKTVLDALAIAYTGSKEAREELEHAYNICPDVGIIAKTIAYKGMKGIREIGVLVGRPIQMMLCQRIENLGELQERTGFPVAVEQKYDGERIQVHKKGNKITLYSRRLENITAQFPEIVDAVRKVRAKDCVIEGEAVAVDKKGNILPFQIVMQRRRKYEVEAYAAKVPVKLMVFEVLYLNGKSLLKKSYPERYSLLQKIAKSGKVIVLANRMVCKDTACADDFFQKQVVAGGEGIVVKSLKSDSTYQAGVRGWHWIKWKPEYVKGMRDTFDLVIVGAYYGRGRRAGMYGALLCACYDDKNDRFLTFCKLGSGFTDKTLAEIPKKLKKIAHKPARLEIAKAITPDVWIEPRYVMEVSGAEITKSPNHTLGYALRFPRFLRWREKKPEQATTAREILKMI